MQKSYLRYIDRNAVGWLIHIQMVNYKTYNAECGVRTHAAEASRS